MYDNNNIYGGPEGKKRVCRRLRSDARGVYRSGRSIIIIVIIILSSCESAKTAYTCGTGGGKYPPRCPQRNIADMCAARMRKSDLGRRRVFGRE